MHKKYISILTVAFLALWLAACAHKISVVKIGMTKDEVIARLGPPAKHLVEGKVEYFHYRAAGPEGTRQYCVKFDNGWVDSVDPVEDGTSAGPPPAVAATSRTNHAQTFK